MSVELAHDCAVLQHEDCLLSLSSVLEVVETHRANDQDGLNRLWTWLERPSRVHLVLLQDWSEVGRERLGRPRARVVERSESLSYFILDVPTDLPRPQYVTLPQFRSICFVPEHVQIP